MNEIKGLDSSEMIKKFRLFLEAMGASATHFNSTPTATMHFYIPGKTETPLVFDIGKAILKYRIFGDEFAITACSGQKSFGGADCSLLCVKMFYLFDAKTATEFPVEIVEVTYLIEESTTWRSIKLCDCDSNFTSPTEFEIVMINATTLVTTLVKAIEG